MAHSVSRIFLAIATIMFVSVLATASARSASSDLTLKVFTFNEKPVAPPDAAFIGADGTPIKLNDFAGKVTLVNFWAIWCAPCVHELPSLDRLQAALGSDDFQVRLISVDRKGREVYEPFLEKLGMTALASESDPGGKLARELKIRGLPATLILDRKARILGQYYGTAEWDSDEMKARLAAFLKEN